MSALARIADVLGALFGIVLGLFGGGCIAWFFLLALFLTGCKPAEGPPTAEEIAYSSELSACIAKTAEWRNECATTRARAECNAEGKTREEACAKSVDARYRVEK